MCKRVLLLVGCLAALPGAALASSVHDDCLFAIRGQQTAAAAAGEPAKLTAAICGKCRRAGGGGCPVGMNNRTQQIVFSHSSQALTCKAGGLVRFDQEYGVNTTYCHEDTSPNAIASFVLAPILTMILMSVLACCMPCIKRRCMKKSQQQMLFFAMVAPAEVPAEPAAAEKPEKQPGCCSAPFDTKKEEFMHGLPSRDISGYSTAQRERITYAIEAGTAMYSLPRYDPTEVPRIFCSSIASLALRDTCCSKLWSVLAWFFILHVDMVTATLRWLLSKCCNTTFAGWHGVDALVKDMWFHFENQHLLLCMIPPLRHPLHPTPPVVKAVNYLTQTLFTFFVAWFVQFLRVGAKDTGNVDYVNHCGSNCDYEVHSAASGYGHGVDYIASGDVASLIVVGLVSMFFNGPWNIMQTLLTKCSCFVCCHSRSRCRTKVATCGFRAWSIIGLPIATVLFVTAANGAPSPNAVALQWFINTLTTQLGFLNVITAMNFCLKCVAPACHSCEPQAQAASRHTQLSRLRLTRRCAGTAPKCCLRRPRKKKTAARQLPRTLRIRCTIPMALKQR